MATAKGVEELEKQLQKYDELAEAERRVDELKAMRSKLHLNEPGKNASGGLPPVSSSQTDADEREALRILAEEEQAEQKAKKKQ